MTNYMKDGGVISSGVPISKKRSDEHNTLFGLYRGVVIRVIYPDDPDNSTKERVEYVVKVNGQEYRNCVPMTDVGAVNNYHEKILKPVEKSYSGQLDKSTYDENVDGEQVYVMFLMGNGNVPIIVGSCQHQKRKKKFKKADGVFDEMEFNGIQVQTDAKGNYTIRQMGLKDKDGTILNPEAKGALIKLGGVDGDILLKSSKNGLIQMDKDGGISIIAKDGSILTMNAKDGSVLLVSKAGQAITMNGDAINIAEKSGKTLISLNGKSCQVTSDKVVIQSKETTINSGTVNIGNGATYTSVIYENLKTIFDGHNHPTAVGPSGPPLPPMTMALMELSPATSAQSKSVKLKGNLT